MSLKGREKYEKIIFASLLLISILFISGIFSILVHFGLISLELLTIIVFFAFIGVMYIVYKSEQN